MTLEERIQALETKVLALEQRQPRKKFQKPTVDELVEYAKSIEFNLDPKVFLDHYEGNGWMVGKCSMKNWKAVVRTWKHRRCGEQDVKAEKLRKAKAYAGC